MSLVPQVLAHPAAWHLVLQLLWMDEQVQAAWYQLFGSVEISWRAGRIVLLIYDAQKELRIKWHHSAPFLTLRGASRVRHLSVSLVNYMPRTHTTRCRR
jgi:hypothetical protein